jgi:phosphatidylinositol glycan class C protein
MNEAIFAAVCLASRLPTSLHGFALLLLALEVFIALPYVSRCYRVCKAATTWRPALSPVED